MSTVNKALRIVIALVLVVAMIGSNCVFAGVTSGTIDEVAFKDAIFKFGDLVFIDDDTTVLDSADVPFPGNKTMVVSELSNEDTLMSMYSQDGSLIYTSYFDYSSRTMYTVNEGETGFVKTQIGKGQYVSESRDCINKELQSVRYIPSGADTGARVAIAVYDDYGVFMTNMDIDIGGFESICQKTNVDISGYYYNEADLAASLCVDLFNSGVPMAMFAAYILSVYVVIMIGTAFILTGVIVNCDEITVQWQTNVLIYNSNGSFTGTQYKFYSPDFNTMYRNTGFYYPIGSLISHNNTLAIECFTSVYPGASASVVSWSNVW